MTPAPNCRWLRFALLALGMAVFAAPLWAAGGGFKIWVMNVDGSRPYELISVRGHGQHLAPRWSHDGKKIAFFAQNTATGSQEVFIANADGTEPGSVVEGLYPDWSFDDKQLLVTNGNSTSVVNIDGNGSNEVGSGGGRFSPDGSQIVFHQGKANPTVLDMVSGAERALDLPLAAIRNLIAWSPDGKSLAIFGYRKEKGRARESAKLLIVGAAGELPRVRLEVKEPGGISYSPGGKQLVFSADGRILIVNVDGDTPPRVLLNQNGQIATPHFSPDGKRIVFSCFLTK